jgi:hypothetical protein
MLYHITSLGFVRQSFDAMVDGIVEVRGGCLCDVEMVGSSSSSSSGSDSVAELSGSARAHAVPHYQFGLCTAEL